MIHFRTDFCEKLLQFVICQFLICAESFFNWRKAQTLDLWETPHLQRISFLQFFEHTWFTTFRPNLYNVSDRPATLRTINTREGYNNRFNVRVGKRVKSNFWFIWKIYKKIKTGKSRFCAIHIRIPQSCPKTKMARLERSNFHFKKSIRLENFEYRRLLDKYQ